MADEKSLVVKNAIGELIRSHDLKVSSKIFEEGGINDIVKKVLEDACARAEANKRKTVMPQDL